MSLASHTDWFSCYVADKVATASRDPEPLRLKLTHTLKVVENAQAICKAENLPPAQTEASLLSALYHDLSRFEQYLQYGTFKDRESRNHGAWSVQLLKRQNRLAGFSDAARRTIRIAVCMHNRLAVPGAVTGAELVVCNVVRDADKLDIVRVMAEHLAQKPYNPTVVLGLPDDPDLASAKVIAEALAGQPASYTDLVSVNDFRLLLGSWLFAMNFRSSRDLFIKSGYAREIVSELPKNGRYREARARLMSMLA